MIYLKTIDILAPFNNDVFKVLMEPVISFWNENGFNPDYHPLNPLKDFPGNHTGRLVERKSSARRGAHTLSDFREVTRPGDKTAVFTFSVISTERDIAEDIISKIHPLFSEYIRVEKTENLEYKLSKTTETFLNFKKIGDKRLNYEGKKEKWEELIDVIPYVDLLYRWLLIGGNYAEAH
ncbi:MAG: hypothetical protein WC241_00295 [Candidatus Paceibacterota bacterium]